jgi:hypothetical protein
MRALILLHRWLGVAFCLFFTMWLTSGIVMHFVPFPRLTEAERLAGLSILAEAEGAEAAVSDVGATITTIFNSTPMTERRNANLFEVLIGQIRQDEKANILLGKPLRVLSETELVEPVRDLLHCGAPSDLPSGEYMRSRGCVLRAGMARIALSESASASFAIRPQSRRPRLIQGEAMACATSQDPPPQLLRIGMRAISMGKSRFQGAAPTAVNVTVRRRGLQISDRTRSQEAALVAHHGRAIAGAPRRGRCGRRGGDNNEK